MKKIVLLFVICVFSFSLTAQITGTVSDEIGPLAFANISIKNSTKGTVSNDQGRFSIAAHQGDTLAISFVGYTTKDIVVRDQDALDIVLIGEVLDEIVLTMSGNYQTRSVTCICYTTCTTSCGIEISRQVEVNIEKPSPNISLLYPNPSSNGRFNLKLPSSYKDVQLHITNMSGQQLQTKNYQNLNQELFIDLLQYSTGIYLVNVIADGERLPTQKAIIQ